MSSNGDSEPGNGAPDLSPHPLVSKLHPEPDEHGANAVFTGYLGPSSKPDHHRVYLDQSFSTYVEVPEDAIVATAPINSGDDNGPTHVTVKADAPVRHVSVASQTGSASYLAGGIASTYLAAGAPGVAAVPDMQLCHGPAATIPWCPEMFTAARTGGCLVLTHWPSCFVLPCFNFNTQNPTQRGVGARKA